MIWPFCIVFYFDRTDKLPVMENREIEKRKERWNAFHDGERADPFLFIIRVVDGDDPSPPLWPDRIRDRVDWMEREYYRQLESLEWLKDDGIPFIDMISGTEIFAEAFGSPVERDRDSMPFALPAVFSPGEAEKIGKPDLMNSTLSVQFEMGDEVFARIRKSTGHRPVFRLPDIQSPMDIAALLWAKEDFFPAMLLEGDSVERLAGKILELEFDFFDAWFARYGKDFVAHYPEYYMPRGVTLSEDEIGAVSADLFDRFFLPNLNALSRRYGGIGIHCCADSLHQWGGFARIDNLRVLNLNRPAEVLRKAIPYFRDKTLFLPVSNGEGDRPFYPDRDVTSGDRGRIIYHYALSDRDEAKDLSCRLNDLRESLPQAEC